MPTKQSIASLLPPYLGKVQMLVKEHDVDDIIDAQNAEHNKYAGNYDKISKQFWQGSAYKTAQGLFDFLKKNVKYRIEPDIYQTVRSPEAILAMGYGDCKHYASFITGVLASLKRMGYPIGKVMYRYAGYYPLSDDVHHVFAVLKDGNREIWIDPVLQKFDDHKPYTASLNKIAGMPLYSVSGIPEDQIGNIFDDIKKGFNNTVKKVEHVAQDVAKGAQHTIQKVENVAKQQVHAANVNLVNVAKGADVNAKNLAKGIQQQAHAAAVNADNLKKGFVITAKNVAKGAENTANTVKKAVLKLNPLSLAARNAFLLILKFNAFNMAHRLYDLIHSSPSDAAELKNKWENQAGGNYNTLVDNINYGMDAYVKRQNMTRNAYNTQHHFVNGIPECLSFPYHVNGFSDGRVSGFVGMDPISISALMTLAAAIIALLAPLLKKAKWSAQDQANATAAIDAGAQVLSNAGAATGDGTFASGLTTLSDGSVVSTLQGMVTTDPSTGTAYVDPYVPNFDNSNAVSDNMVVDPNGNLQPTSFTDDIKNFGEDIKLFWDTNKKPILITTGLVVAWKMGVFTKTHKVTRRK